MKLKYRKKSTKTVRILEGGGKEFFWLARIYTPGVKSMYNGHRLQSSPLSKGNSLLMGKAVTV